MKRFIFIFLLVLLPLQASWGVVSVYATQEHDSCSPTCSEAQMVQAKDGDQDSSTTPSAHHEDRFCGLHALGIVETGPPQGISFSSDVAPRVQESRLALQIFIERPERPKWNASA